MLKIEASPRFLTVGVGETVNFKLVSTDITELLLPADKKRTIWAVAEGADSKTAKIIDAQTDGMQGQGIGFEFTYTFDRPGKFIVMGGLWGLLGDKRFGSDGGFFNMPTVEYQQNVQPTESFMWDPVNRRKTHVQDPDSALRSTYRYLGILNNIATPLYLRIDSEGMGLRTQHEAYYQKIEKNVKALESRLNDTIGWVRIPLDAFHRDDSTGQITELKLFLAHPNVPGTPTEWRIVDWSHPGDTRLDGEYKGATINDALMDFQGGNQYPPGAIGVTVPANVDGPAPIIKGFKTTGRNFWGTVVDFLQQAAFWTGLLAAILTIVPIPGFQIAGAALWLGLFSGAAGTAAAGLSLYERHARGVHDFAQDAMDALSIVACVAGVGGGWAKHATLAMRFQGAVRDFVMVGAVTSDALQGVLIAKDMVVEGQNGVDAIFQISADTKITPREKIERLIKVIGKLTASGVMIYANVKSTKAVYARIKELPPLGPNGPPTPGPSGTPPSGSPAQNLEALADPAQRIDLTQPTKQTGTTTDGSHTTTVEPAPERARVAATGAAPAGLLPQAVAAGAAEQLGAVPMEVFAHGTSSTVGLEMVETQGGNLSPSGGKFGGRFFTVPETGVAKIFASRTASGIPGDPGAVVGMALPRDVAAKLRSGPKPLLTRGPIPNPPPGVSPNAQQWVFERGAIETIKREGFFFLVNREF